VFVAQIGPHPGGGKVLSLVGLDDRGEPSKLVERDRIGELLERQERLEEHIRHVQGILIQRDTATRELLQRVLLLVNHYGRAPWFGRVTSLFGREHAVVLERPGPDEGHEAQAPKVIRG
jgi:hypothetical protein